VEGYIPASPAGLIEYYIRVNDGFESAAWPPDAPRVPAYVSVVAAPPVGKAPMRRAVSAAPATKAHMTLTTGPMLVRLSWDQCPALRAFKVMRSADGRIWDHVAVTRDNWYEDRTVELGGSYRYRILDADTGRVIAESGAAKAQRPPLPAAPGLTVAPGPGRVRLSWNTDDGAASDYRVHRSPKPEGPFESPSGALPTSDIHGTRTCVWDAEPSKQMYYAIRAISLDGREGPLSKPVCAVATEANASPVLALNFDGSDSVNVANGVVEQGIPALRTGTDSFVALPHKDDYNTDGEITIQFWVKLRSPGVMPVLIAHGMWNQDGFFVQHFGSRVRFYLAGVGTLDTGHIELGRWTAVTATYDGAEMTVYLNGQKAGSQTAVGLILPAQRSLYIGRYEQESRDFEVDGWIGGVRIYPYAVGPEAAQGHYQEMVGKLAKDG